ncbi:AAA family ATPase [Salinimicrobium soli]|uniref:AAA family ATPase n=1 Tax=Salinimicrobium soli TaxID=1254399 RepID=UPI003AAACC80
MKILKIEFQNINSLKGDHEIDFTEAPFTVSSLFAITGPTGSGKSSILDVISLALFNQVPRLGKISRAEIINKGALLTRNQKEASAKVTYQCKSGIYASFWNISTARTGNLRDYEMQIFDMATDKALDLKKSDVPAKNEELIGLSYDQFIKAVLLAQGEFAQFLRARKDERGELLEKITGTGIYRQLGIKAFQKKKEVSAEIEKEQQEIELHRKSLLEEEEQKAFSEALYEKDRSCKSLETEVEKLKQNLQLKTEIRERTSEIQKQLESKKQADYELKLFEAEEGEKLQKHEKIRLFGEELTSWQQTNNSCKEVQNEIELNLQRTKTNFGDITNCLEEIKKFIKSDTKAETVEQQLQEFSEKVRKLEQQREEKGTSYKALKREFETEVREVPFQLNGNLDTAAEKLQEMQGFSKARLSELERLLVKIDLENPLSEKQRLRKELEQSRQAERQVARLQSLFDELQKLKKEEDSITPQLEELPKKIALDKSGVETLNERLQKLQLKKEYENLRRSLEEHRHSLHDGEPCPLCGALEHPYAKDLPAQEDGLQEEIKLTEKELSEKQRLLTGNETTLAHYKERLRILQQNEQEKKKELHTQKSTFEAEFGEYDEKFDWAANSTAIDKMIQALENYEEENRKLKAISAGLPILKKLQTVLAEGLELKAQLDEIYSGDNVHSDCLELQKKWNSLQHQKNSLTSLVKEQEAKLHSRSAELERLERSLFSKVQKEGCKDISDALARLLPEQSAAEMRQKKERLCNQITRIEVAVKTLELELQKLKAKDIEKPSEAISEELRNKQQELQKAKETCEELRRKLNNHKETLDRIENIEAGLVEKKQKIRRWELLNHLIGDATGKKFNDFAQDLTLSRLLQLANFRLKDLSDRYHLDKPVEGEDDSLVAIDEHMGAQRRSVKTLSGGETFILSLSMALALSDLASKNVEINSLFIDEGFGTLDPETLDQTLDTLERLQAESAKTIGIISHVDSLKERIATQIQLKRNGQGYSSLEITG